MRRRALAVLAAVLAAPSIARTQGRAVIPGTVRIIVPFNAGGISDILARGVAQHMSSPLGNTVVVENRPGANGSIGATAVARAAPDGTTLLLGVTDTHAVNPAAMQNLPYDAGRDFTPVSLITRVPLALAIGPSQQGITDIRAFVAAARSRPNVLTYASWGVGSTSQLAMLRLAEAAGFEALHVPFTGAAPAQQALAASQVDAMVMPAGAAEALARDGRVRALATLAPERLALLPQVPTLGEQGVALTTSIIQGIFAPGRTPPPVVLRLNEAMQEALRAPGMLHVLRAQAAAPEPTTSEGLAALVVQEQEAWGRVVRAQGIRLD
jgi:tripartite-type tricarboxylate transporter receptor subunit TctC